MLDFLKRHEVGQLISLQSIIDGRGRLVVMEKLPFEIKRVYFLRDIEKNAVRGGHAHKKVKRLMVALNGSFRVTVRDNKYSDYTLSSPEFGLLIDELIWVELSNFSKDAICLVLASEEHDEADCIRSFKEFIEYKSQ